MIDKHQHRGAGRKGSPQSGRRKGGATSASISIKPPPTREVLTPRERAVLNQIGRGASSKEAGARLGVSARTIEFHRTNIMRKLGIRRIVDLMLLALKTGDP
jgi:DNA-binding CsgD family transcriptional regulator